MVAPPKLWEPVAQPVEHLTFNQRVSGSNPDGLTKIQGVRITWRTGPNGGGAERARHRHPDRS